jgi:hypothetical protein
VNELCDRSDRIITAAECVTNEMLSRTWRENLYCFDVCRATDGAILNEFYCAHKELCEVQCLKMCRLVQFTFWLEIKRPDVLVYFI